MKTFTLNLTQFDYFLNGGGCRIRRHDAIRAAKGDDVNVRFDGNLYPATVTDIYVEGGWAYAHLAPRKASHV